MRDNNIFQKNILRIKRKCRVGAVIVVMALSTACLGCGEQKPSQGNNTNEVVSESKSETVRQTEATTEAPTETKKYSFEDAKTDVIWHFRKLLGEWMSGKLYINDSECKTDDKGYTITVRYNYGENEYKYGVGKDIYVATVFVEKDTKIMEYLSGAEKTLDELADKIAKGKKVQL